MAITFPRVFPNKETFSSSIEAVLTSKTKSFNCVEMCIPFDVGRLHSYLDIVFAAAVTISVSPVTQ